MSKWHYIVQRHILKDEHSAHQWNHGYMEVLKCTIWGRDEITHILGQYNLPWCLLSVVVFVDERIDAFLMQKHMAQCVEEIVHDEEDWERSNNVHLLWRRWTRFELARTCRKERGISPPYSPMSFRWDPTRSFYPNWCTWKRLAQTGHSRFCSIRGKICLSNIANVKEVWCQTQVR